MVNKDKSSKMTSKSDLMRLVFASIITSIILIANKLVCSLTYFHISSPSESLDSTETLMAIDSQPRVGISSMLPAFSE